MDVIDVAGKVGFIAYLMFPISMLPDGLFALDQPRRIGRMEERCRAMFGEAGFDQTPARREVGIIGWQGPDAVKMVGHDDDGIDAEWTRSADGPEGIAQDSDGIIRSKDRSAALGDKGEEEGTAGNKSASVLHGGCRVTLG